MYVSDRQEDVFDLSQQVEPRSPQLAEAAAEQQGLERMLESLREKLKEISKESTFYDQEISGLINQAEQCMRNSTTNLSNRNGTAAMRSQKDAMFSLNNAANKLLQSMQNQSQCNKGSCNKQNMFKKMNQMCKNQQKVNKKSSSMCQNPGQKLGDQGAMRRLTAEQGAIQKSLEQLQKEQGNRREILGRLDQMAREVSKVVEDLESGVLDENTLERQYKIHSRMLDFQRSLERQDFKEERKADTGRDMVRRSPGSLRFDNPESSSSYQDRLQKYLNEKFPEEYEEIVKKYFRTVNNQQENQ